MATGADAEAIKRQLYNRQGYVVGAETQRKYGAMKVLLCGAGGLGCEVAKNIILTGVQAVTIVDDAPVSLADLSSLFYAGEGDVGQPRAARLQPKLAELNRFVEVTSAPAAAGDAHGLPSEDVVAANHVVVLCDKPTTQLAAFNAMCRKHGAKLVCCESRGVCGSIFVDAGEGFVVHDTNGEETVSCVVTSVAEDGTVLCHEDKKHETVEGDKVYFSNVVGVPQIDSPDSAKPVLFTVEKVCGPYKLRIKLPAGASVAGFKSGYMNTTKQAETLDFAPLGKAVVAPEFAFVSDDESKLTAGGDLHLLFRAAHSVAPPGAAALDVEAVLVAARALDKDANVDLLRQLAEVWHGNLNPMAAFLGGFAAQEVLKCGSGKFTPVKQFLYYDCRELLMALPGVKPADREPRGCRYDGQIAVIGRAAQAKLEAMSGFIVGAGALGCEHIKNVGAMGVGTAGGARVTLTDMDTIELSNLSRQFLFRPQHIGKSKSRCAAEAAAAINPAMKVVAREDKVAADTEHIFNDEFWEGHHFVLNALDNVLARKYVDERCVHFCRPLFESGTLGAKCNMQSVIPTVTESYGNSQDPPEKSIPLCTLKNFPNAIEHTIQWARDQFHGAFVSAPQDVNSYLGDPKFIASLDQDPSNKPKVLAAVCKMLNEKPTTAAQCAAWGRRQFDEWFNLGIKQLLHNMPPDMKTPDGTPFWGGAKKPPTPLAFDPKDTAHCNFVLAATRIFARVNNVAAAASATDAELVATAAALPAPQFVPKVVKYQVSEEDKAAPGGAPAASPLPEEITVADLPPREKFAGVQLTVEEFEKDDDANHHIAFITATSNLRAANYAIPPADAVRTKMIAGKIIPAMITTTALVTGLVGFELLKFVCGADKLPLYRNAFVNVALPLVAFTHPMPPPAGVEYTAEDGRKFSFTMWDRIEAGDGTDMPVGDVVKLIEQRYGLEICMMSTPSGQLVFNGLAPKPEVLAMPLTKRLEAITKKPLEPTVSTVALVLSATVGDEDVDVPAVRFRFR